MLSVLVAALFAAEPVVVTPQPVVISTISTTPIIAPPPPAIADCCVIKALTPVRLAIINPINSNQVASGQQFAFALSEPILLDGGRSIPAGTPGQGEVIHASRSGMAGKAGELVLAARYLDYQGTRIPLRSMRFGENGKDQTGVANAVAIGAAVVAPLAGIFALAITGGEVRVPAGARAEAKVSADTRIGVPPVAVPVTAPSNSSTIEGNVQ